MSKNAQLQKGLKIFQNLNLKSTGNGMGGWGEFVYIQSYVYIKLIPLWQILVNRMC